MFRQDQDYGNISQESNRPDAPSTSLTKNTFILLISFFSNTFSAISGGGAGLLQLPALILSGTPYYQALASHKFATCLLYTSPSPRDS